MHRITAVLLLCLAGADDIAAQALRPVRVMQESPWVISPLSDTPSPMHPVRAYWDPETETHFIDLAGLLRALHLPLEIEGARVRTQLADTLYEIDFAAGVLQRQHTPPQVLPAGGFLRDGDHFLLTPPNLERVFPDGVLICDPAMLHIRFSHASLAPEIGAFRARTLTRGPLLYGRTRKILGAPQLGYRISRVQRPEQSARYYGSLNLRASALWGRIEANGSSTRLRQLSYLLDFPESPRLTQIGVGRTAVYRWPLRRHYEGLRLSNRPLSTRHQQRETDISGIAEPNALVSAFVNGVLADRVQADSRGRYRLSIPTSYGTSQAEVEIIPAGGGAATTQTRYLFVSDDLVPAGTFYWDVQAGRDQYDHSLFGYLEANYGLTRRLTARSRLIEADTDPAATLGIVHNIGGFAIASADVAFPHRAARAALQLVRDSFQLQGEASLADQPGLTPYRQHMIGRVGWNLTRLSLFLDANRLETFNGSILSGLHGSGTLRIDRKTSLIAAAGVSTHRLAIQESAAAHLQWRTNLTRYVRQGILRGRVGLLVDGGRFEDLDFAGLTAHTTYRRVAVGVRAGYDFAAGQVNASLSVRLNAPWAGFSSHTALGADAPYHRQQLYGSVGVDRGLHFSRRTQVWSSALLNPFVDEDHNGIRDPGEALLTGLDINVVRARTRVTPSGGVRADYLVPSTRYQVVIDPRSIRGPALDLATGTAFSFVSDPGETKQIDIPVQRNTIVEGTVTDLPLSSLALAVAVFYQNDREITRAALSQQGRFTILLAPGSYRVELVDLLGTEDLSAFTRTLNVEPAATQTLQIP